MDTQTRELKQLLSHVQLNPEILLLKKITGSTNDDVKALAQQGIQSALICSEQQTQGRGQRANTWQSPQGNIYLSCIAQTQRPLDGRFALEVALNLIHMPCLNDFSLSIKWPNDLYSLQGKWGGILVEPISAHQAIVGVGINLVHHASLQNLDQPTTALTQLGHLNVSRIEVIAQIYSAIQNAVQWFNHNSQNLAARFNHVALYKNEHICFESSQQQVTGLFLGIQDDGAVCIETNHQTTIYYEGRMRPTGDQ